MNSIFKAKFQTAQKQPTKHLIRDPVYVLEAYRDPLDNNVRFFRVSNPKTKGNLKTLLPSEKKWIKHLLSLKKYPIVEEIEYSDDYLKLKNIELNLIKEGIENKKGLLVDLRYLEVTGLILDNCKLDKTVGCKRINIHNLLIAHKRNKEGYVACQMQNAPILNRSGLITVKRDGIYHYTGISMSEELIQKVDYIIQKQNLEIQMGVPYRKVTTL